MNKIQTIQLINKNDAISKKLNNSIQILNKNNSN
jgi:hypothetical protein